MRLTLPWPDSRLNPNAARRIHWRVQRQVAKGARSDAFYLAKASKVSAPATGSVPLAITFHAPDKRRRDMDNAIAAMKPQLDGLADAMRVDDNRFRLSFAWGEPCKHGRIEIVIGGNA